jgi:hypothetical protein
MNSSKEMRSLRSDIIGISRGAIQEKSVTMLEFKSEPPKSSNSVMLITAGVLLLLLGGIFLIVKYQGTHSRSGPVPIQVEGLLRPGNTNFDYYKTRIKIENVKALLGVSFNKARSAMISGVIFNDGDRKLQALELHIVLYDMSGKALKERTAFALRPGTAFNKEILPLQKRVFTISIESIEENWNPEQISYELTGLKYE